jgi:hypothetical protein
MARILTVADVLNAKVDQAAFQRREAPAKKAYRIRSGNYLALMDKIFLFENDSGVQKGRRYMSVLMKLHNAEQKFRGSCFTKMSWMLHTKNDGTPDLMFRLFQDVLYALGAPPEVGVNEVVEAVPGSWVEVWGKEFFNVAIGDVHEMHQNQLRSQTDKVYIYINDASEDDAANYYLGLDYKSQFQVLSITKVA